MPQGRPSLGSARRSFRLGDWLVEPEINRLSRPNETVRLEIKVMGVLVCLAAGGRRLVLRSRFIEEVWGGSCVSDNTLTRAIAELRRALGDDANHPEYVETIHRRGYRLLKQVSDLEDRQLPTFTEPSRFRVYLSDRNIQLRNGENSIGRRAEASICVRSLQVSRHHARIIVQANRAYIEDLGSTNGTLVNGHPILEPTRLRDGDRVLLGDGNDELQFRDTGDTAINDTPGVITSSGTLLDA